MNTFPSALVYMWMTPWVTAVFSSGSRAEHRGSQPGQEGVWGGGQFGEWWKKECLQKKNIYIFIKPKKKSSHYLFCVPRRRRPSLLSGQETLESFSSRRREPWPSASTPHPSPSTGPVNTLKQTDTHSSRGTQVTGVPPDLPTESHSSWIIGQTFYSNSLSRGAVSRGTHSS